MSTKDLFGGTFEEDDKIDLSIHVETEAAGLDFCSAISRKQALAAGAKDEVCPKCQKVFFAHDTSVVVRCHNNPCHYDPQQSV